MDRVSIFSRPVARALFLAAATLTFPSRVVAQEPVAVVRSLTEPTAAQRQSEVIDALAASYQGDLYWPPVSPDQMFREQFQPAPFLVPYKTHVTTTWLAGGSDEIGITDVDLRSTFSVPRFQGFTITPRFGVHFIDGPTRTDLPARVYDAAIEFSLKRQLNPRFSYQLAVSPGVYSDFERNNSDAIRIMGRGLGFYTWSPATQLVFGVVYLDREDVRLLPAFGFIHTPREDLRFELVFPKPRIAIRISHWSDFERWLYLAGEFGGGSWAIERANGAKDIATYSDWRLMAGIEQKQTIGPTLLFEIGLSFNRKLQYQSNIGNFDPDSTFLLRAGTSF